MNENQKEMKRATSEMKNTPERIKRRLEETEDLISGLEHR